MTGEVVQSEEGISREFSLPRKRETRLLLSLTQWSVMRKILPPWLLPLVQTWGLLFLNLPLPGTVLEILFSLCVKGNLKIFR